MSSDNFSTDMTTYITHLLQLMGFEVVNVQCNLVAESNPTDTDRQRYWLAVQVAADSRLLIGAYGAHLEAVQHLVRMYTRHYAEPVQVTIDVNDYRVQREEKLRAKALEAAEQVQRTGQTLVLQPMGPADRRIVHSALSERADVRTESMGSEPRRRVVVKPVAF